MHPEDRPGDEETQVLLPEGPIPHFNQVPDDQRVREAFREAADPAGALAPPGGGGLLGTDHLGRDVPARVVHGARHSVSIGVAVTVLAVSGGVLLGLAAGLSPKWLDEALARAFDVLSTLPEPLLAPLIVAITGPGTPTRAPWSRRCRARPTTGCSRVVPLAVPPVGVLVTATSEAAGDVLIRHESSASERKQRWSPTVWRMSIGSPPAG
nr:hypothetical protein [Spongiactinospora gelatinilytica]